MDQAQKPVTNYIHIRRFKKKKKKIVLKLDHSSTNFVKET